MSILKRNNLGHQKKWYSISQNKHILAHPFTLIALFVVGFVFACFVVNFVFNYISALFLSGGSLLDNIKQSNEQFFTYFFKMNSLSFPFYILACLILGGLWGKQIYKIRQKFKKLDNAEHASGRWATKREIINQYKAIPQREMDFEGEGGLPVAMFQTFGWKVKLDSYRDQVRSAKERIYEDDTIHNKKERIKESKQYLRKEFLESLTKRQNYTFIDESAVNNIFVGTSRSGKGEIYVLPMIENYTRSSHKPSLIVNDTKGELGSASIPMLEERDYHWEVFNLDQPMESTMSFNLLQLVIDEYIKGDLGEAQEMTKQITYTLTNNEGVEDNEWNVMSGALINAMILALCSECLPDHPEKVTLYSVSNMLQTLSTKTFYKGVQIGQQMKVIEVSALDEYMHQFPTHNPARTQYATVEAAPDKMRSSIIGTALKALQPFTTDTIAKLTSHTSMDLNKIGFPNIIDGYAEVDSSFEIGVQKFNEHKQQYEEVEGIITHVNEYGYWQYPFENILKENDRIEFKQFKGDQEILTYLYVKSKDKKGNVTFKTESQNNNPDIRIRKFNSFEKPIALFMVVPDYNSANHGIASILVNQVVFQLAKNAQLYTAHQKTHRRVVFHLDEAGQMPQIPNLSQKVNVMLGRGIRFNFFVQAFSQIKDIYGDSYDAIMDACQNKVYIMATQMDTLKEFSEMLGDEQIVKRSRSGQANSLTTNFTEDSMERALLRPDELERLQEGETVVVRNLKRQDKKRRKVTPYPIFNHGKRAMKYRYQYLGDIVDTNKSIIHYKGRFKELCEHRDLNLETTLVDWQSKIDEMQKEYNNPSEDEQSVESNKQDSVNNINHYQNNNTANIVKAQKFYSKEVGERAFTVICRRLKHIINFDSFDKPKEKLTLPELRNAIKQANRNNEINDQQCNQAIQFLQSFKEEV